MSNAPKNQKTWEEIVQQRVKSMRFGVVQIVVHENKVVRIERSEKIRVDHDDDKAASRPVDAT